MKSIDVRTMTLWFARSCLLSAVVLTGLPKAKADDKPAPPPDGIRRMTAYAGVFEGDGTLTMGDKTYHLKLRHENVVFADGWGLMTHETVTLSELPTYRSENLFGFDLGAGRMHLFTVSNGADTHDHAGSWVDDTHLNLRYTGLKEGLAFVEEIPLVLDGPDQYSFQSITTVDGKPDALLKATMRRRTDLTRR